MRRAPVRGRSRTLLRNADEVESALQGAIRQAAIVDDMRKPVGPKPRSSIYTQVLNNDPEA